MAILGTSGGGAKPDSPSDELMQVRRELVWYELYAVAVLVGFELSVVYVIGTLVINCFAR